MCVVLTQLARSEITTLAAHVTQDTLETHLESAHLEQHVSKRYFQSGLFSFSLILEPPRTEVIDPCNPSPCGSNAICQRRNNAAACQCIPEYFGDPYVACRPECVVNSDCPSNKACQRNKCIDPCPGTCGINARCQVKNHLATCTCFEGYIGDPFTACRQKPIRKCYVAHLVRIDHLFYCKT